MLEFFFFVQFCVWKLPLFCIPLPLTVYWSEDFFLSWSPRGRVRRMPSASPGMWLVNTLLGMFWLVNNSPWSASIDPFKLDVVSSKSIVRLTADENSSATDPWWQNLVSHWYGVSHLNIRPPLVPPKPSILYIRFLGKASTRKIFLNFLSYYRTWSD